MNELQIYSKARYEMIKLARTDLLVFANGIIKECFQSEAVMCQKWVLSGTYELQQILDNKATVTKNDVEIAIDRILFNASPRMGKTTVFTLCGIIFDMGRFPKFKQCLITASESVLKTFSGNIRKAIESEFFKAVFPNFQLIIDNVKSKQTKEGGSLACQTAGSSITGGGYHRLWFDDFVNPKDLGSKAKMSTMIENLKIALGRKEYNPRTKIIVVEQKLLGTVNITDTLVSLWQNKVPYKHIEYPYQYEKRTEYDWYFGEKLVYEEGEFVDIKFDEEDKQEIIATRGIDVFLREYMCKTIILGKIIIKREYFGYYSEADLEKGVTECFITTDFGLTNGKKSDNTVFCCWAITKDNKLLLIDMVVLRDTVGEAMGKLHAFYNKWKNPSGKLRAVSKIFIEDGSHSKTMIEYFQNYYNPNLIEVLKRSGGGSKYARYTQISGFVENANEMYIKCGGNVLLPNNEVKILGVENNHKQICEPFLSECEYFTADDRHDKDDIVDNLIDAVKHAFVDKKPSSFASDFERFNRWQEH